MHSSDTIATIRRVSGGDAEAYRECVESVAKERRYLARVDGFSAEETNAFLQGIADNGWPMVVATACDRIVGWCGIIPRTNPGYTHVANLGMGVLEKWRGQGIGRRLIEECLALARSTGLERIELSVYSDNAPAIRLYESLGFSREGQKKDARKVDGNCQDEILMALRF